MKKKLLKILNKSITMNKRIFVFFMALCISLNLCITANASGNEKTVSTQSMLNKAINDPAITKIIIKTKKETSFTISESDATIGKEFEINAPNAKITNRSRFSSIQLLGKNSRCTKF